MGGGSSMCLRTALYEDERRIKQLEADNEELKAIAVQLWLNQFSPIPRQDREKLNKLMRKHGIEVYP